MAKAMQWRRVFAKVFAYKFFLARKGQEARGAPSGAEPHVAPTLLALALRSSISSLLLLQMFASQLIAGVAWCRVVGW